MFKENIAKPEHKFDSAIRHSLIAFIWNSLNNHYGTEWSNVKRSALRSLLRYEVCIGLYGRALETSSQTKYSFASLRTSGKLSVHATWEVCVGGDVLTNEQRRDSAASRQQQSSVVSVS